MRQVREGESEWSTEFYSCEMLSTRSKDLLLMNMLECARAHERRSALTRTHLEQNLKPFTAENEKARLVVLAYNKTKCKSICFCHTTCSSPRLTFFSRQLPIRCLVLIFELLTLMKLPFPFATLCRTKIWSSKKEWYQKNRNTNTNTRELHQSNFSTKLETGRWNGKREKNWRDNRSRKEEKEIDRQNFLQKKMDEGRDNEQVVQHVLVIGADLFKNKHILSGNPNVCSD